MSKGTCNERKGQEKDGERKREKEDGAREIQAEIDIWQERWRESEEKYKIWIVRD